MKQRIVVPRIGMPQIAEERPRHSGIERPPAVLLAPQDKGALRSEGRCEEERRGQGKHDTGSSVATK